MWKLYKQQKIEKDEIKINCFNKKTFIFVGIKSWEVVTCEGSHLFHNGTDTSLLMTH